MDPIFWPLLLVVALVGGLFAGMPTFTRPDVFFSVTVAPSFRETADGRLAVRIYRLVLLSSTLLALAILGLAVTRTGWAVWAPLALLPQVIGSTAGLVTARARVMKHAVEPAPVREAVVARRRDGLPGGWPLQALPFIVLATVAVVLATRWSGLPARIPVHWGTAGNPDRWTDRTLGSLFGPLIASAGICAGLLAIAVGTLNTRRVHAAGDAAAREARFRRLTMLVLLVAEAMVVVGASQAALAAVVRPDALNGLFGLAAFASLAAIVVLVVQVFRLGQGGAGRPRVLPPGAPVGDRTPDSAWKWGLFYVNPSDPALLVEKRFGIGYTLNFGRPVAWGLLALAAGGLLVAAVKALLSK